MSETFYCHLCDNEYIVTKAVQFDNPPSWTKCKPTYVCKSCFNDYEPPEVTFDDALGYRCEQDQIALQALSCKRAIKNI